MGICTVSLWWPIGIHNRWLGWNILSFTCNAMNNSTAIITIIRDIVKPFHCFYFHSFFFKKESTEEYFFFWSKWIGTDNFVQLFPSNWNLQSLVLEIIKAFGLSSFIFWIQIVRRFISSLLETPGRQSSKILVPFARICPWQFEQRTQYLFPPLQIFFSILTWKMFQFCKFDLKT